MAGTAYGVVVGVENYSIGGMTPVKHAHEDAQGFADVLTQHLGLSSGNVSLWLDRDANRTNLEIELPAIVRRLGPKDRFYFFYAGHGLWCAGSNRLTAWDTHPQHLHGTTVDLDAVLLKPLRASSCCANLVFIDACAVEIVDPTVVGRDVISEMDEQQFRDFVENTEHTAAFFSCSPRQKSYSLAALGHGIWSHHVLQALQGREPKASTKGYVTGHSLLDHLVDAVPRYIREKTTLTGQQTPYGLIGSAGDFAIRPMPVKAIPSAELDVIKPNFAASTFQSVETLPWYWLPGFDRSRHTTPDRASTNADSWARRLLDARIKDEIQQVHDNAKRVLKLSRREIAANHDGGGGSVDTETFRYEVTSGQSDKDPGEAFVLRELVLRVPPSGLPDDFDEIFPKGVEEIVVPFKGSGEFYDELADALETMSSTIGGSFTENTLTKMLTLTLKDGAILRFDTKCLSLVITPPSATGCLQVIERLGQGSFATLLGGAPLRIGARAME